MASTPDYSEANAAGYQDIQAARQQGVAPSPEDAALLRMPAPKSHPLIDPETGKPLDFDEQEVEGAIESARQGPDHSSDTLSARFSPFRGEQSSAETPLENTPEAEEFLASFDTPTPQPPPGQVPWPDPSLPPPAPPN